MNQIMQLVRRHLVSGRQSMLMVHVMIHMDYFHIVVMYLIVPAIMITYFWDETKKELFCFCLKSLLQYENICSIISITENNR